MIKRLSTCFLIVGYILGASLAQELPNIAIQSADTPSDDKNVDHWAIIVAGSKDIWNYRHQADACHAYQILKKNGMPEDRIIHFSFNDLVTHRENPFRGQLFNRPNGHDVYNGCKIDYFKDDVNPKNFLAALTGEEALASTGGKVLRSGKNSKVFMYLVNHGATGLLAFPNRELLFADELIKALKTMHQKGLYGEMVIYLEGSNTHSLFNEQLPNNIKILGMSATNPTETSFATYCYPDDKVNGEHVGVCLGDLFSVNWLEDSDTSDPSKEHIEQQMKRVKQLTHKSTVTIFGDTSIAEEPIGNFQGDLDLENQESDTLMGYSQSLLERYFRRPEKSMQLDMCVRDKHGSVINSRDAKLHYFYSRL